MKNILILFAHPALERSRVNRQLISGLQEIQGVVLHDLYEEYPEMDIDIKAEQARLESSDVIIFHHPFFWYSTPAILKEWQDLVLEHGWAYGHEGSALEGKWFFNVLTTGGMREAYCKEGYNSFTIRQLLAPTQQTAKLCKMIYLPPFVVHGTLSIADSDIQKHRENYHQILEQISRDDLKSEDLTELFYLNDICKGEG